MISKEEQAMLDRQAALSDYEKQVISYFSVPQDYQDGYIKEELRQKAEMVRKSLNRLRKSEARLRKYQRKRICQL